MTLCHYVVVSKDREPIARWRDDVMSQNKGNLNLGVSWCCCWFWRRWWWLTKLFSPVFWNSFSQRFVSQLYNLRDWRNRENVRSAFMIIIVKETPCQMWAFAKNCNKGVTEEPKVIAIFCIWSACHLRAFKNARFSCLQENYTVTASIIVTAISHHECKKRLLKGGVG